MPGRLFPLVTGEIYHVFNRGIDGRPTFIRKKEYERVKELIRFYQWKDLSVRYSVFREWDEERQQNLMKKIRSFGEPLVEIIAYCFMPNHFHLLVRQSSSGGTSKFLSNMQNSYTRYFNTKNHRLGSLFLDQFKAVRIEDEVQLLHVSRYIHLNPYTAFVVKTLDELSFYPWTSIPEYLELDKREICQKQLLMGYFKNVTAFRSFVFDHAAYQRRLIGISHLTFES
jgi:putative transposase